MDFDKLRESCRKISMPPEMKSRIKTNCKAVNADEKQRSRTDGRLVAVCVCCILLLLGIGLTYSGIFERKLPAASDRADASKAENENKFAEILSTAKITADRIFETTRANIDETEMSSKAQTQSQQSTESTVPEQTTEFVTNPFVFPNGEHAANTGSDDLSYVRPLYLEMSNRENLIIAKEAAETMSQEDFDLFLAENQSMLQGGYFHSMNAGEYLEFTQREWYIPVAPEDMAEICWMYYEPTHEKIDLGMDFSETSKIRFDINETYKADYYYKDSNKYRYEKTIQRDNATIKIYSRRWLYRFENFAWKGYRMDITVCGQEMSAITTEMPLEELEKYLEMIDFVTIKDWLS
ncbi:MAG: hypothetical protein IJO03_02395 [Clostridia bacterium]|nr:hypothetical protein [Clostridia bacterium]